MGADDSVYGLSLWKLSMIYERFGQFEKAILTLVELDQLTPKNVSLLSIRMALSKNYRRVGSPIKFVAPTQGSTAPEIFASLQETTDFNYDHLMVEELQFLGEIQIYFIQVMETSDTTINVKATQLLISLYDGFFKALSKDTLNVEFKKKVAIELLDQMRKFDLYKLNGINLNPETIPRFSNYSTEKQKIITDWLHQ